MCLEVEFQVLGGGIDVDGGGTMYLVEALMYLEVESKYLVEAPML